MFPPENILHHLRNIQSNYIQQPERLGEFTENKQYGGCMSLHMPGACLSMTCDIHSWQMLGPYDIHLQVGRVADRICFKFCLGRTNCGQNVKREFQFLSLSSSVSISR